MRFPACGLFFGCLLAGSLMLGVACNNTLNPLCSSARPAPLIQSISPNSMSFADVQKGATLTVDGSQFVSATQVMINSTTLAAPWSSVPTIRSSLELKAPTYSGLRPKLQRYCSWMFVRP